MANNTYDLLIQDFVSTNKLVNQNVPWTELASRRLENGRRKVFQYGAGKMAGGEHVDMSDGEWLIITLRAEIEPIDIDTLRFDCLKMMYANTHYEMEVVKEEALMIRLRTRNRGLMNVMFRLEFAVN
jgi:hypothetical protein